MHRVSCVIAFVLLTACAQHRAAPATATMSPQASAPTSWSGRLARDDRTLDRRGASELDRFYVLPDAAKASFELGRFADAKRDASEALEIATRNTDNWNYGNAIHDGHMVLGRLALHDHDIKTAIRELKEAGATPGSPQLDSFGPNMSLAADLLAHGRRAEVISYFDQCKRFWKLGRDMLASWRSLVAQGEKPDFGANLIY